MGTLCEALFQQQVESRRILHLPSVLPHERGGRGEGDTGTEEGTEKKETDMSKSNEIDRESGLRNGTGMRDPKLRKDEVTGVFAVSSAKGDCAATVREAASAI